MLKITNTEDSFIGCRERFLDVVDAMEAKVSILEAGHNKTIEVNNPSEYFLETDYILTAFNPFPLGTFDLPIVGGFTKHMNEEEAQKYYDNPTRHCDIVFESDGETSFLLKFITEETTEEYSAEFNKKADSFRYIFSTETGETEETAEFIEFVKFGEKEYAMQSKTTRCYIEFDDENKIISFCCGELRYGEFTLEDSIFPDGSAVTGKNWVLSEGKSQFSNIHTFENGILTHEDCSSGPWKSIKINEKDYESAFYGAY
ncbi:MAG: hypothetical protein IKK63_00840 [Clostridia bacterium]|nr:hypothetical protein [Clostridia bacterium]